MREKNNKKVKNKTIIIFVIIVIVIIGIIIFMTKNKSLQEENIYTGEAQEGFGLIDMNNKNNVEIKDGKKENNSIEISKERSIRGLVIKDIKLLAENGISYFTATVKNESGVDFSGGTATIQFINQDGSEYANLDIYIPEIKKDGTNSINASTTSDITNAYNFNILMEPTSDIIGE